jgi:hypothetical protein
MAYARFGLGVLILVLGFGPRMWAGEALEKRENASHVVTGNITAVYLREAPGDR